MFITVIATQSHCH